MPPSHAATAGHRRATPRTAPATTTSAASSPARPPTCRRPRPPAAQQDEELALVAPQPHAPRGRRSRAAATLPTRRAGRIAVPSAARGRPRCAARCPEPRGRVGCRRGRARRGRRPTRRGSRRPPAPRSRSTSSGATQPYVRWKLRQRPDGARSRATPSATRSGDPSAGEKPPENSSGSVRSTRPTTTRPEVREPGRRLALPHDDDLAPGRRAGLGQPARDDLHPVREVVGAAEEERAALGVLDLPEDQLGLHLARRGAGQLATDVGVDARRAGRAGRGSRCRTRRGCDHRPAGTLDALAQSTIGDEDRQPLGHHEEADGQGDADGDEQPAQRAVPDLGERPAQAPPAQTLPPRLTASPQDPVSMVHTMVNQRVDGLLLPVPVAGHPALELCNTRAGWYTEHPREYLVGYARARRVGAGRTTCCRRHGRPRSCEQAAAQPRAACRRPPRRPRVPRGPLRLAGPRVGRRPRRPPYGPLLGPWPTRPRSPTPGWHLAPRRLAARTAGRLRDGRAPPAPGRAQRRGPPVRRRGLRLALPRPDPPTALVHDGGLREPGEGASVRRAAPRPRLSRAEGRGPLRRHHRTGTSVRTVRSATDKVARSKVSA